ncbi:DEKNAAC103140 [Brettanomyces naardenensis]|uniref:DEKNAAC103140 n=1 Tax=Brettanomyces naardenensis TaxID=13370 RepID=A0A448YMD1_BRENA|nr:DEKNAAC103140 [Brettanomyces naardenensis]
MSDDLKDEISAIEAIYPDCIQKITPLIYKLRVPQHEHIIFKMSFPFKYPAEKPSILDVTCEDRTEGYDERYLRKLFQEVLDSTFQQGVVVVFDFFTELDGILYNEGDEEVANEDHWEEEGQKEAVVDSGTYIYSEEAEKAKARSKAKTTAKGKLVAKVDPLAGWSVSEVIKDRKSTFVGFAREVHSVEEVNKAIDDLSQDSKIAKATHMMRAYRIGDANSSAVYEDCDDDGEAASGSRLLHLLSLMDAWNVLVVVVRWFGGVHLGPVRFRHINECARDALVKGELVEKRR